MKFVKAEIEASRLKMYVYGGPGTGKTVTALQFPNPAVIDGERGTVHYGDFGFHVINTTKHKELMQAIDSLLEEPNDFKTVVIDPYTIFYTDLQIETTNRLRIRHGKPDYQLQPKDWNSIKNATKELANKLLALDMNIIITAREATLYSQDKGDFMIPSGTKPEGPKDLPYLFDTVLRLEKVEKSDDTVEFWAFVEKDRTNKLPKKFLYSYDNFVQYIGIDTLTRAADVGKQREALEVRGNRNYEVDFKGQKLKTAGVLAKSLEILEVLVDKHGSEEVGNIIKEEFMGSGSVLDLKEDEAQLLIQMLKDKE